MGLSLALPLMATGAPQGGRPVIVVAAPWANPVLTVARAEGLARAETARVVAVHRQVQDFHASVGRVVATVERSLAEMEASADVLTRFAWQTGDVTSEAAANALRASGNVRTSPRSASASTAPPIRSPGISK